MPSFPFATLQVCDADDADGDVLKTRAQLALDGKLWRHKLDLPVAKVSFHLLSRDATPATRALDISLTVVACRCRLRLQLRRLRTAPRGRPPALACRQMHCRVSTLRSGDAPIQPPAETSEPAPARPPPAAPSTAPRPALVASLESESLQKHKRQPKKVPATAPKKEAAAKVRRGGLGVGLA